MKLTFRTEEPAPGLYEVTAYDEAGEVAGFVRIGWRTWLTLQGNFAGPSVSNIMVHPKHRRRAVATRLYEAAARMACHVWDQPLRSGVARTANAENFWQKQVIRGRASCLHRVDRHCIQYETRCPAPSLGRTA